jgi:6,7-dimethyl-8-ribityllumazine synthase
MTAPAEIAGPHHDATGRYAVVVARFNPEVTEGLLAGARDTLAASGVTADRITVVRVPGAFEIPLAARTLAASGRFDAVVCLGCLIKGETMHFEYIAEAAARGIAEAGAATGVPVTFGVLTTLTDEQALARARTGPENKGHEAALAAVEMAGLLRAVRSGAAR